MVLPKKAAPIDLGTVARPSRRRNPARPHTVWVRARPLMTQGDVAAMLPRKEVIQPQLPLRLPCYDFVPITRPTFGGCLPCGLAHRLQVLPAFMT